MSTRLEQAKRLVVKIGTTLVTEGPDGALRGDWLEALADDVAQCRGRGQEVVLVSSGAIAVGRGRLKVPRRVLKLEEKQAAAAVGQIRLAHAYQQALDRHAITVAQVLLTFGDTEERRRYLNARNTLNTLLHYGAVPVINENDTVATAEIRFGDNDRLAARVAQMVSADVLVLLSDVDGLYTADPALDAHARRLDEVHRITPEIEAMARPPQSEVGSGGMITKLEAAKIALAAGCHMVIARGAPVHALAGLWQGVPATWFLAEATPLTARKRWIAGALKPAGSLSIDAGAVTALFAGKSLLPAGVVAVDGAFDRGDAVRVTGPGGDEIGRGLCAYSAIDARRILGHKSSEIAALLGYVGRDEMIHRDDLVLHGLEGKAAP